MKPLSLIATVFGALIGIAVGICGFTFTYAKGGSYLTNNPAACANCHVMQEQYDGWSKSSHRAVATCNDCHTPANVIGKYATKMSNGFKHSYYFTVGGFPEPIHIAPGSLHITEQACRHCHQDLTSGIDAVHGKANLSCVRCHRSVGHLH
jgi:cytochrome c nitrite reductase small subunit